MRELTYFVAVSLDGFIAGPGGRLDAFPAHGDHIDALFDDYSETLPAPLLATRGVRPSNRTFDTVIMGWNTYQVGRDHGLTSPYPHLRQLVCTRSHSDLEVPEDVEVVTNDVQGRIARLKSEDASSGIWLCGGGVLAAVLFEQIDRLVLKRNPVVIGAGVPLFSGIGYAPRAFVLEDVRRFDSGVSMQRYVRATAP